MALTLAQIFGADAIVDDSVPTDPKLVITLTNFQNTGTGNGEIEGGFGLNDATTVSAANADSYSHKLMAAIIMLHNQNQLTTNDDDSVGTYIDYDNATDKRFVTRNEVPQVEYRPSCLIYTDDPTTNYDPDDVRNA